MGLDVSQITLQIRKFLFVSVGTCYSSVCTHPFLSVIVLYLVLLQRTFPFVFSLLVSSSPIIVCTAVLLGTLLSFGQPNISETEPEDKRTHEIMSLKTEVSEDLSTVSERDKSCSVERFLLKKRVIVEKENEETSFTEKNNSLLYRDDSSVDNFPLIDEKSQGIQFEKQGIEEVDGQYNNLEFGQKNENYEAIGNKGMSSNYEEVKDLYPRVRVVGLDNHERENDKSLRELVNDLAAADPLDSSLGSWKLAEEHAETSDSGSDIAESYSPDASMDNIIPMLQELHALLDLEAPQPAHDDFGTASQQFHKSNDGSDELHEVTDNHKEDGDDLTYGDDDDEETQVDKEDNVKSAISWTEDDQKSLMDLGTSESERNRRLENLIARRRAQKNMRIMADKNLIDFTVVPFQIAPISTVRHNLFEMPDYTFDEMGLLAIPGSAPSILLPGRDPFDLPYDSNEEKPDLRGDNFQQEFMPLNQKDKLLHRHESFSFGHSLTRAPKHGKHDMKFRPCLARERSSPEGRSYPPFQRQSSEVSDSKLSSVTETESKGSTVEKSSSELREQLPGVEMRMIIPSADDNEELQEVDVFISTNLPQAQDPEDKVVTNYSLALVDTSMPFENSGSHGLGHLQGDIIDGVFNEDHIQVFEEFHFAANGIRSLSKEHLSEEADKINDIDGLLSELDTVGDFSIKETISSRNEMEGLLDVDQESLVLAHDAERRYIEGVEDDYDEVNKTVAVICPENDSAFKKINEDEIQNSIAVGLLHTEVISEHIKVMHSEFEISNKDSNLAKCNSEFQILEARSIEDIDLAFKRVREGIDVEKSLLLCSDDNRLVGEFKDPVKTCSELQVVELRSLEGIDMVLKQYSDGELEKMPQFLDTRDELEEVEIKEAGFSEEVKLIAKEQAVQENSTSNEKLVDKPEDSGLSMPDV